NHGKWRLTYPTKTVLAYSQAQKDLSKQNAVASRHKRNKQNKIRTDHKVKGYIYIYLSDYICIKFFSKHMLFQ
ncbi:hypothetical protein ACQWG3_24765, partial [Salmonella enterica subsp. enterica serovar Infantis]